MRSIRGRHRWRLLDKEEPFHIKKEECIHCSCRKHSWWNAKLRWYDFEMIDMETGEVCQDLKCLSKQLILEL